MKQIAEAMGLSEHDVAVLRLAIRHGLEDPCQPFEVLHYTLSIMRINHKHQHAYLPLLLRASLVRKASCSAKLTCAPQTACCSARRSTATALLLQLATCSTGRFVLLFGLCTAFAARTLLLMSPTLSADAITAIAVATVTDVTPLPLTLLLLQSRSKVSENNLVRFKTGYVPPEGLRFSMDFNVNGNVDTRDSILAAAAGGGSTDADADDDDNDDNDEQQWQRSWDLSLFQQAVLVIKRAGATGLTGIELKELFGLNRKECDKVSCCVVIHNHTISNAGLNVVHKRIACCDCFYAPTISYDQY
jgi:hypothetical protein